MQDNFFFKLISAGGKLVGPAMDKLRLKRTFDNRELELELELDPSLFRIIRYEKRNWINSKFRDLKDIERCTSIS